MQKAAGAVSSEQAQAQVCKRWASGADPLGKAKQEASRDRQRDSGWSKRDSGGLGKRDSLVSPPSSSSSPLLFLLLPTPLCLVPGLPWPPRMHPYNTLLIRGRANPLTYEAHESYEQGMRV